MSQVYVVSYYIGPYSENRKVNETEVTNCSEGNLARLGLHKDVLSHVRQLVDTRRLKKLVLRGNLY